MLDGRLLLGDESTPDEDVRPDDEVASDPGASSGSEVVQAAEIQSDADSVEVSLRALIYLKFASCVPPGCQLVSRIIGTFVV